MWSETEKTFAAILRKSEPYHTNCIAPQDLVTYAGCINRSLNKFMAGMVRKIDFVGWKEIPLFNNIGGGNIRGEWSTVQGWIVLSLHFFKTINHGSKYNKGTSDTIMVQIY